MIYYLPRAQEALVDEINLRVDESGGEFKTLKEFRVVLTEVLKDDKQEKVYTPEEEEKTKERSRGLGYIQ